MLCGGLGLLWRYGIADWRLGLHAVIGGCFVCLWLFCLGLVLFGLDLGCYCWFMVYSLVWFACLCLFSFRVLLIVVIIVAYWFW